MGEGVSGKCRVWLGGKGALGIVQVGSAQGLEQALGQGKMGTWGQGPPAGQGESWKGRAIGWD